MNNQTKTIIYIDMDSVLVEFTTGIDRLDKSVRDKYGNDIDEAPGIFSLMDPVDGAIKAFNILSEQFDVYILSTAPWNNSSAWADKLLWVQKYLGNNAYKKLILTHHKNLNKGDYLIDDRTKNGAAEFEGEHILFRSEKFPDWESVLIYIESAHN